MRSFKNHHIISYTETYKTTPNRLHAWIACEHKRMNTVWLYLSTIESICYFQICISMVDKYKNKKFEKKKEEEEEQIQYVMIYNLHLRRPPKWVIRKKPSL